MLSQKMQRMNVISYYVGEEKYSFDTMLRYNPSTEDPKFQLKEQLREEVLEHMRHLDPKPNGVIHDVFFEDESGITALVKDFKDVDNYIKITKYETV